MLIIAWSAILVTSPIFNSLVDRFFLKNAVAGWPSNIAKVVFLSVILVIALLQTQLRPIGAFLAALMAYSVGYLFVDLFESSQMWLSFRTSALSYQWVMADSLVQFLPALLMLVVAFVAGQTWKSLFLTRGDLSTSSVINIFGPNSSWAKLTICFSILFLGLTGSFLIFRLRGISSDILFPKLAAALPYIIIFPILNAINEELRYRNVLLAVGGPVLGATAILLMTTVLFGLVHFGSFLGASGTGGSPIAGFVYALGAAFMGWVNGRSILETRGTLAAWIIHACADLVIILGYILTA